MLGTVISSREIWWELEHNDTLGLYSGTLTVFVSGALGLLLIVIASLFLAMPNSKGFWVLYLSALVTLGGIHFPGQAPLSYIPFLSFLRGPSLALLSLAGNILTLLVLVALHLNIHREAKRTNCPNK